MPRTINSLQAGRGLASMAVVLHHCGLAARDFGGTAYSPLIFGYLGVDFFFVLSGFIIYHSTVGRGKAASQYAVARFKRVYLPYWPIGIGFAVLYLALPSISAADHPWSWLPTLTLLPVDSDTALAVAWTLKHEILFYLIFGAAFFTGMLWPALMAWAALIGVATVAGFDTVPLQPINLEFLFGVVAADATRRGQAPLWLAGAAVAGVLLWMALGADRDLSFLVGLAIACLIPLLVTAEWQGRFAVPAWLVFLGAASYSIYLTHLLPIALVARALAGHPVAIILYGAGASLAVGIAYHLIVERPLLRYRWPVAFWRSEERSGVR